ncbi:DUF669 domain-containing protein [Pseudomonas knackmussii]|uniref:DUF669 domain-containing protein n=1 Tax=Pseudomonas knackmussii TaxID=65741 RepID=UPI003F4A0EC3
MAQLNFNAAAVEPAQSFELIPAGSYTAIVESSDIKPTKANNGHYISLKFQIIDGQFKGRLVFSSITLDNPNQQAVQIGQGQLSSLCRAINVMQLQDTSQLHDKPLRIKVGIRKDKSGQYPDQNEVKGYESCTGGVPTGTPPAHVAAAAQQQAAAGGATKAPWSR